MAMSSGVGVKRRRKDCDREPLLLGKLAERRVTAMKELGDEVAAASAQLCRIADNAINAHFQEILDSSSSWTKRAAELFLVAIIGLEGVEALRLANQLFPVSLGSRRLQLTADVVNAVAKTTYDPAQCSVLFDLLRHHSCGLYKRPVSTSAYNDILVELSEKSGHQYAQVLLPPVEVCINGQCIPKSAALCFVRQPVSVTVYTLIGPQRALKVSLKCSCCNTIYNYSTYGRKRSVGERLYEHQRELVEVSDTVFCSRDLYELFCSLRSVKYNYW